MLLHLSGEVQHAADHAVGRVDEAVGRVFAMRRLDVPADDAVIKRLRPVRVRSHQLVPDPAALQGHHPLLQAAVSMSGAKPPQNMRLPSNGMSAGGFIRSSCMTFAQPASRIALSGHSTQEKTTFSPSSACTAIL